MSDVQVDLSKCTICGGEALFTDSDPGANPVSYDAQHLPQHLRDRAAAGQLGLQGVHKRGELEDKARELDIEGRSKMGKDQLASAVAKAQAAEADLPRAEPNTEMSDAPPPPVPGIEQVEVRTKRRG